MELLSFQLTNQSYAVDIMSVQEIREWTDPTPLPQTPPHVLGVINLRGLIVPIIDLGARLACGTEARNTRGVIIVVNDGDQVSGLLVDNVSDILTVPDDSLYPPPEATQQTESDFLEKLYMQDEDMIRILNVDRVLGAPLPTAA